MKGVWHILQKIRYYYFVLPMFCLFSQHTCTKNLLSTTCTDNVFIPSGLIASALRINRLGSMGQLSQFLHLSTRDNGSNRGIMRNN